MNENDNMAPGTPEEPPKKRIDVIKIIKWVLIAVFAGVFLYSATTLIMYYWASYNTQKGVDELRSVITESTPRPSPSPRPSTEPLSPDPTDAPPGPEDEDFVWKQNDRLYPLLVMNPDTVGWITIDGTNIDYPVMQTGEDDPDYYLNHGFDKNWDSLGLPFLDYRCELKPNSTVMLVYGHNIRSKIMFHHLLDYEDEQFWHENQYIIFDTIYGEGIYQIFSVFRFDVGRADKKGFQFHRYVEFENEDDFNEQMAGVMGAALYDTGITPEYGDKFLVLATCEYSSWNGRLVVYAREVQYTPSQ